MLIKWLCKVSESQCKVVVWCVDCYREETVETGAKVFVGATVEPLKDVDPIVGARRWKTNVFGSCLGEVMFASIFVG